MTFLKNEYLRTSKCSFSNTRSEGHIIEVKLLRWKTQGHILKSLALALKVKALALKVKALASKPQVLENFSVLGSRAALFFEPLKCSWKTPETSRSICKDFFVFLFWRSHENFSWRPFCLFFVEIACKISLKTFFLRTLAPVYLSTCVPPWPRIFFVSLASSLVSFASSLVSSTP